MIKSFVVDATFDNMRLDRFLRNKIGKIPQGLIEKSLIDGWRNLVNCVANYKNRL